MADTTTPPECDPVDATEINRRQMSESPDGITGQVGQGVDGADFRLVFDSVEQQENTADERDEEGRSTRECPPVNGEELLVDIERFAGRFLALPTKHHLVVLCLWAVHTWAVSAFYVTPRLVLDSPEPGSGKTRVLEILALLCHDAKLTVSTTTAALYRRIKSSEDKPPTILQDECDTVFGRTNNPQAEDLRGLFNAGYKTGATVDRCEGHGRDMTVVDFPVSGRTNVRNASRRSERRVSVGGALPVPKTLPHMSMGVNRIVPDHRGRLRGSTCVDRSDPPANYPADLIGNDMPSVRGCLRSGPASTNCARPPTSAAVTQNRQ